VIFYSLYEKRDRHYLIGFNCRWVRGLSQSAKPGNQPANTYLTVQGPTGPKPRATMAASDRNWGALRPQMNTSKMDDNAVWPVGVKYDQLPQRLCNGFWARPDASGPSTKYSGWAS